MEKSVSGLLGAVRALTPAIAARSDEIEAAREVPRDLMQQVRLTGALRMTVPRAQGGEELSGLTVMEVLETLAAADASVAWLAMVAGGVTAAYAHFPPALIGQLFAAGGDVPSRGSFAPRGVAMAVDGGYRVTGRWPFASGHSEARWVMGACLIRRDGEVVMSPGGAPQMRVALMPASAVSFIETWDAVGLRGTASHDFAVEDVFVPEDHIGDLTTPSAGFDTPLHSLPFLMVISPGHGAVALGIAKAMLADLTVLAKTKTTFFNPQLKLAQDPTFQFRLGQLTLRLMAARACLVTEIERCEVLAESGAPVTGLDIALCTGVSAHVQGECTEIVSEALNLAGASACYLSSSLQRRWRDMRCVRQHIAASESQYHMLGQALLAES